MNTKEHARLYVVCRNTIDKLPRAWAAAVAKYALSELGMLATTMPIATALDALIDSDTEVPS